MIGASAALDCHERRPGPFDAEDAGGAAGKIGAAAGPGGRPKVVVTDDDASAPVADEIGFATRARAKRDAETIRTEMFAVRRPAATLGPVPARAAGLTPRR